jgi:dCMP deaminase
MENTLPKPSFDQEKRSLASEYSRPTPQQMWLSVTQQVAKRSTCKRLQVGAVITNQDMTDTHGIGYNGNYAGGPNTCDSDEPGNCGCIHAEENALLKTDFSIKEKVLFCTDAPCLRCAKLIINAQIAKVYFGRSYRKTEGIDLLKSVDIEVFCIS